MGPGRRLKHTAFSLHTEENAMADNSLTGLRVAILATDGFEQSELLEPRKALDAAGADTTVVSLKEGSIRGWTHKDWGQSVNVDRVLEGTAVGDYDALLLPGGVMNPDTLRMQPKAVAFVKAFFDAHKPVGAICHGPWSIVEAGAAKGLKMTSWPSLKTDIRNAGGEWVDQEVVVDRNLVTSRKPDDLPAFNREIVKLFGRSRTDGKRAVA
jgi:protease I